MLTSIKKRFAAGLILLVISPSVIAESDTVTTYKDEKGWKLQVNGDDFYIKGVVWGYTPRNENFTFNLWGLPEQDIKNVLDHDFSLMQKAGVNAIRSFATIPPKWVTYINDTYGIKTVINPLMGRYGADIGGTFIENPDYSDPLTRTTLIQQGLDAINKYKDVRGVIMFALGNEANYGLSWSSFEIENLPVGEQNAAKAKHLYSMYGEAMNQMRAVSSKHPITIVNGDIQYLDLITKYSQDMPMLGVNAYRGETFTSLWKDVKTDFDKPVVFFEFGSDAFNARDFKEDQFAQAEYLRKQWQDMYSNAYGHGYGNSIGGFVFEWRDEWWKFKQTENLNVHDTNASWENGGYKFDHVEGQNNMNEEWFGITRLGEINSDGVYIAEPRMAYDVLSQVWTIDPYRQSTANINTTIDALDMKLIAKNVAERDEMNGWGATKQGLYLEGGSITFDALTRGYDGFNPNDDETNKRMSHFGQSAMLDFRFNQRKFSGEFSVNMLGNATDSDFEFKYGDRIIDENQKRIELYDLKATYSGEKVDVNAFYHVPRYHWGYKGDFFGLMREVTDMDGPNGQDIWNAKAPYGLELVGKGDLDGLTIVGGPEIYWGANPKVIAKYRFGDNKQYSIIHSEEYEERDGGGASATDVTKPKNRQTTVQAKFEFDSGAELEVGGLISGTEKIDDTYDYVDNGVVKVAEVQPEDTLGFKAKLSFDVTEGARAYTAVNYAGLIADAGAPLKEFGTQLPYSELGNKREVEGGIKFTSGHFMVFPRVLYRENLLDANPLVNPTISGTTLTPGVVPRNSDDDPFAVLDNRAVKAAEIYLTYDPTPETPFYEWDNDDRENAGFAFNVGLTAMEYTAATDAHLYFDKENDRNAVFSGGLDQDKLWLAKSKMVFNPSASFKAILNLEAGKQQSTGEPADAVNYQAVNTKLIIDRQNIFKLNFAKDKWGPYDFQRQFNVTYPQQWKVEYVRLLDRGVGEKDSSRVGVKAMYRTLDDGSPGERVSTVTSSTGSGTEDIYNDHMYEVQLYYTYKF